ncbi:hydroxymethylbilane synthase [bacterium]|nr:hydroxymethylbilane synthase [bacterium]
MSHKKIVIATRGSALALKQTQLVADLLSATFPAIEFSIEVVRTKGDTLSDAPLSAMPGRGVFVKEIEDCLVRGQARMAVHSMKDLPTELPPGLCIAAVPERADYRDVLISGKMLPLENMPPEAVIGTGSPRRKAQLLAIRPDLRIENIRGNLDTRIAKLRGTKAAPVRYDAIVVAAAGCLRAGYEGEISEYFPPELILPAAGQGALAVECREDDLEVIEIARSINNPLAFSAAQAERALVRYLGGGCHTPIAALATAEGANLRLRGAVLSPDGKRAVRAESSASTNQPEALANDVAKKLISLGARDLIRESEA